MAAPMTRGYQEASDILSDALKQMDGIIAGTVKSNYNHQNGSVEGRSSIPDMTSSPKQSRAVNMVNDLRSTLEGVEDRQRVLRQLPSDTQSFLRQWLEGGATKPHAKSNGLSSSSDSLMDRVRRLEAERENLTLQVSVLHDQIEAQLEKIQDLEAPNGNVGSCRPGQDMMKRPSPQLDRRHGEVLAENSDLKLRLATSNREKLVLEERLDAAQRKIDELQSRINQNSVELVELQNRVVRGGSVPSSPTAGGHVMMDASGRWFCHQGAWHRLSPSSPITPRPGSRPMTPTDLSRDRTIEREKTLDRLKRKHTEVDKLKKAVDSLMIKNDEKDLHIEELKRLIRRYKKLEEIVISTQGRKAFDNMNLSFEEDHSDSSSAHNSNTSADETLRKTMNQQDHMDGFDGRDPRAMLPFPTATSTPVNAHVQRHVSNGGHMTPPSCIRSGQSPTPRKAVVRSNSLEVSKSTTFRTPPTVRRQGHGFGTLPKDTRLNGSPIEEHPPLDSPLYSDSRGGEEEEAWSTQPRPRATTLPKGAGKPPIAPTQSHGLAPLGGGGDATSPRGGDMSSGSGAGLGRRKQRGFMSFGKGFFKVKRGNKWSTSAPNLVQSEAEDEEALKDEMAQQYKALRETGGKQPVQPQDAQRKKNKGLKRLFGRLKRASSQDLDEDKTEDFRRAGLRSTAGARLGWSRDLKFNDLEVPFARWDSDRLATWLHSMGLSMYVGDCKRWARNGEQLTKASPHEIEKELGIKNLFHRRKFHLALQAASTGSKAPVNNLDHNWVTRWLDDIGLPQYKDTFSEARIDGRMLHNMTVDELLVLKVNNTLHHLSVKRAIQVLRLNDFSAACLKRRPAPEEGSLQNCPGEVSLWTNHRVMEWLRSIDLSEYAPNLRGSGVHGGLLVLEPRFSADVFATLLSIPANKTLLRRHLSTHLVALIGSDTQAKKRQCEMQPGFMPLTPNQKVKLKKRLFSQKRPTRPEAADEDLICPMDTGMGGASDGGGHPNGRGSAGQGQGQDTLGKENMLAKERFMDDVPTSDV